MYIGIKATPGANPLDVIKEVRKIMPDLQAQLPPNLKGEIAYDATLFIQASINEVIKTLFEAVLIVIVVVFLFLGALRSVVIPVVTIPLSMIGVMFFMQMMGYSINLLTLLAMVLAIGLVVDDAIVVVENIHRHIEEGKTPLDAAIEGAREIAMPVVSMTITLAAVYAPIGFLTGLTGALFKEFALTLAGAVVISGVVALTLSPMMCALLLRHDENPSGLAHRLDRIFESLKRRYQSMLHGTLNTRPVVLVFAVIVLCLIPVLLKFTKSELAPDEDQGIIFMLANAPQPTNLDYLSAYTDEFVTIFKAFPGTTLRSRSTASMACNPGSAASCSSRGTSATGPRCKFCPRSRRNWRASPGCRSSVSTCRPSPALARACPSSSSSTPPTITSCCCR